MFYVLKMFTSHPWALSLPSCDNPKGLQILSDVPCRVWGDHPPVENHYSRMIFSYITKQEKVLGTRRRCESLIPGQLLVPV